MTNRFSILAASAAMMALATAGKATAADDVPPEETAPASYPYIEGSLDLELGDDFVVESDDASTEINDLYFTGNLAARMHFTPILSLNVGLTLEAVEDPLPFEDRFFGDHGLYMDTLNLQAEYNNFSLLAGKFGPGFGTAWDNTPGVFGTVFAEDYELSEQIGFGLAYTFDAGDAGQHTLGANIFYADNTFLSDSIFTRRGQTHVSDGGVGNTGELDNFSVTLDGSEFAALPGFTYHLGYRRLSAGITETADENGFVGGVAKETELSNGMVLGLNGELAYFDNVNGIADDHALYATAGLSLTHGPWHGELAGTLRKVEVGGVDFDDHIVQASIGYEFENGIDLSAGYAHVREAAVDAHVIGVRLTKSLEFSTRN
jgi:hypothetical protein